MKKYFSFLFLAFYLVISFQTQSFAATKKKNTHSVKAPTPACLIVDANTGTILHQSNAEKNVYPASLTKMMTIYLTFEAIKHGKLSLDTRLPISKNAASKPRSKLGLIPGETIRVKELILSLIVKSANDSATVLGEGIAGTEGKFAHIMTQRAHQLGMRNTIFANASGWHHPTQKTTAFDMAKLAMALKRDYPEHYHLFSRTSFFYKNTQYKGHNRVVEKLRGAEGMKTGYTGPAGFNLVTTAKRGDIRLVGVVMGSNCSKSRDAKMIHLMNYHFDKIQGIEPSKQTVTKMTKIKSKRHTPKARNKRLIKVSTQTSAIRKASKRTA